MFYHSGEYLVKTKNVKRLGIALMTCVVMVLCFASACKAPMSEAKIEAAQTNRQIQRAVSIGEDTNNGSFSEMLQELQGNFVHLDAATIVGADTDGSGHTETFKRGRTVVLSSFYIGKTEVTYSLWYTVVQESKRFGYRFLNEGTGGVFVAHDKMKGEESYVLNHRTGEAPTAETENHPVTAISWCDAIVWCNAYSELLGKTPVYYGAAGKILRDSCDREACLRAEVLRQNTGFRLPTNAEWEYAARGGNPRDTAAWGNGRSFAGGSEDCAVFNTDGTQPVMSKRPNSLGLYDMSGNISEYCFDVYAARIAGGSVTDPDNPHLISGEGADRTVSNRVVRGGSWKDDADACTVSEMALALAYQYKNYFGLRLVTNSLTSDGFTDSGYPSYNHENLSFTDIGRVEHPAQSFSGTYEGKAFMCMDPGAIPTVPYAGTFTVSLSPADNTKVTLNASIIPGRMGMPVNYDLGKKEWKGIKPPKKCTYTPFYSPLEYKDGHYAIKGQFNVDVTVKSGRKSRQNKFDFSMKEANSGFYKATDGTIVLRIYYPDIEMESGAVVKGSLFFEGTKK